MFRRTLIAATLAAFAGGALAAVTAEEAKQLGSNLTPIGAEKAGNKDGTIPEYTGGLTTPPAAFKKGDGIRPDPFASEKPLYSIDREEHRQVRRQADRGHEGASQALSRVPRRRLSDASHGGDPQVRGREHAEERDPRQDDRGRHRPLECLWRRAVPDPEGRPRGDVEPSDALRRLYVPIQSPHLHGGRERQAGADHRDDQHQRSTRTTTRRRRRPTFSTWYVWTTRVRRAARAKASSCTTR